ncbi:monofunctional biosynthetic peptidoglycan transglycosylase [Hyphomicrobium sp.]|uniref:monofunctional biosynthetic peptidoglycan transglycosylase n=1 Tax=Hyphomicrobium sp. TaxID=82 RepID=UPI002E35234D|nr:monofunctional biosynthetic peptidoglycan transglycosylase [Hyphomicrobium sp.]HEX2841474.1 monofunctional biosynthetic peptidoglycan transglycosylase [Hyphomicrobium sp.]
MADKDTRDDLELRGEPLPLPDGPRSEGGPATAPPDAEIAEESAAALESPDHPSAKTIEAPDGETCATLTVPAETGETWHAAIADALSPPSGELHPDEAAAPSAPEPVAKLPDHGQAGTAPTPSDVQPITEEPAHLPEAPSTAESAPAAQAEPPSFTDAAQDLFRPSAGGGPEDPHLITIGRRLDPSLRVPRPTPPVIAPRYEPDPELAPPTWKTGSWTDRLRIVARYAAYAAGGYLALVLVLILLFRFINPPGSMLMLTKLLTGNAVHRTWAPIESISPALIRAVVVSEDDRFCEHSGIDTAAMKEAIERASRGTPRGASTISMQVTKNLFLWNAKSYIRKIIEIPLTLVMEVVWPKQRILEVYLNIAEWGPGIFGAEAAARHHFRKSAAQLNDREAALLAAVLPNPVARDAGSPGPGTSAKARVIQSRVRAYGAVASCVVSSSAPPPAPAVAKPTQRKTPLRTPQKKKPKADDWAPTLNFGPQ